MLPILWFAAIVAGFAFPSYLIKAIRSSDEENEVSKNTVLACVTFGIIILSLSLFAMYS